jgi:hypothetical protein
MLRVVVACSQSFRILGQELHEGHHFVVCYEERSYACKLQLDGVAIPSLFCQQAARLAPLTARRHRNVKAYQCRHDLRVR